MYSPEDLFLTSDYILERLLPEEIFEAYLYPVDFARKYTNPFREDNNPDCNYYVSGTGKLYFVDNAWGKKHYNCFSACMSYYKCTFSQALRHIYEDLIKEKKEITKIDQKYHEGRRIQDSIVDIKIKVKDFTEKELKFWNIGGLDITQKELNEAGIYSVKTFWENDRVSSDLNMVFAYVENGVINQIYYPNRRKGERRFINRKNFLFGNLKNEKDEILVVTKSKKDAFFLNKFGISAIYTANETITVNQELLNQLKEQGYTQLYSLMDKDWTGLKSAVRHRKLGITPLFVPEGKDMYEWIKLVGYQSVIDTIEQLKNGN